MRIRLLAGLAVAAALLGLTACRSSPEVVAYVGDEAITEARVTRLIDDYVQKQREYAREQAAKGQQVPEAQAPDRKFVVHLLVQAEVCDRLRDKLGFQVQQPSLPDGAAELYAISEKTKACRAAIPAQAVEPTEMDLHEVFDAGVRLGLFPPDSFDEYKDRLKGAGQLSEALGQRKMIKETLKDTDITVNPKYGVVELALLSWEQGSALALEFGEHGPVVDAPRPATDAPAQ